MTAIVSLSGACDLGTDCLCSAAMADSCEFGAPRLPSENGIPPKEVARCRHWPECFCLDSCIAPAPQPAQNSPAGIVLIFAIIALAATSLWIGFSWGAVHG